VNTNYLIKARQGRLEALKSKATRAAKCGLADWEFASSRGVLKLRRSQMIDNIFRVDGVASGTLTAA